MNHDPDVTGRTLDVRAVLPPPSLSDIALAHRRMLQWFGLGIVAKFVHWTFAIVGFVLFTYWTYRLAIAVRKERPLRWAAASILHS